MPWAPPSDLDRECLKLCEALNENQGIRTISSCCGHGKEPYRIWLYAEALDALPAILYCFDGCHCGHYGWRVTARTDCAMSPVTFMAEGPIGAYEESEDIASLLQEVAKDALPD